jgi:glucose-6-phosphate isomerase, archaeal
MPMKGRENKNDSARSGGTTELGVPIMANLASGELVGERIQSLARTIENMKGIFRDETARQSLNQDAVVYRVQGVYPVGEGEEGGLFWGTTFVEPGMVGDEYFMTKGHFHANRGRGEYYLTVSGRGALILMDENRRTSFESMHPGTLHYVQAHTAHRVANVGGSVLAFWACWPSDAGHDYDSIASMGFSARLRKVNGIATMVEEP